MTSDQTASEIGNRYFRYLITRCGRTEIFLGRLLSALTLSLIAISLTGIGAFCVDCYLNGTTSLDSLLFVIKTCFWVFWFCLPFVCLCSMISAWSGSVATSMLCSMSLAFLLPKVFNAIELKWKKVEGIKDLREYFPANFTHSVLLKTHMPVALSFPLFMPPCSFGLGVSFSEGGVSLNPIVETRDLGKAFGATIALKGVNLEIPPHQVIGLVGPNGAGKTTHSPSFRVF